MRRLSSLWASWVGMWAHREAGTVLALARILCGLVILWTLGDMLRTDTVMATWVHVDHGGMKPLPNKHWLVTAMGGTTPGVVYTLMAVAMGAGAVLVLGLPWLTQPAALLANQTCVALFSIHSDAGGGHDRLIVNLLWLLVFARSAQTLSVSARWRTGRWLDPTAVPAWPRYLMVVQLCLVYGATGIQKLGAEWFPWGGLDAVYRSLLLPSWYRFELAWIAWIYPLTQASTFVSWWWETTFPLILLTFWWRRTRTRPGRLRALSNRLDPRVIYGLLGLIMHGSLQVAMNLGPFSAITLTYYVALWHPDEWARLGRRLRRLGPTG